MLVKFDKGYFPDSGRKLWQGDDLVQLRFENHGVSFVNYMSCGEVCSVNLFIKRIKNILDGMIRYHKSLDVNDTQFLAERLYLGEGNMLNLAGRDGLVYLGSHRTHRNFVDKFCL